MRRALALLVGLVLSGAASAWAAPAPAQRSAAAEASDSGRPAPVTREALAAVETQFDRAVDRVSLPTVTGLLARDAARGYRLPGYGVVLVLTPRALPSNGRDVLVRVGPRPHGARPRQVEAPDGGSPREIETLERHVVILQNETEQARREAEQDMERIAPRRRVRVATPSEVHVEMVHACGCASARRGPSAPGEAAAPRRRRRPGSSGSRAAGPGRSAHAMPRSPTCAGRWSTRSQSRGVRFTGLRPGTSDVTVDGRLRARGTPSSRRTGGAARWSCAPGRRTWTPRGGGARAGGSGEARGGGRVLTGAAVGGRCSSTGRGRGRRRAILGRRSGAAILTLRPSDRAGLLLTPRARSTGPRSSPSATGPDRPGRRRPGHARPDGRRSTARRRSSACTTGRSWPASPARPPTRSRSSTASRPGSRSSAATCSAPPSSCQGVAHRPQPDALEAFLWSPIARSRSCCSGPGT